MRVGNGAIWGQGRAIARVVRNDAAPQAASDASTGRADLGIPRHRRGGANGAIIVLWKAATCHAPPAARWMKSYARARDSRRCSNVPSVHLATNRGGSRAFAGRLRQRRQRARQRARPDSRAGLPDLSSRAQGRQKVAEGERRLRILRAGVEAGADARRDEAIATRRPLTSSHRPCRDLRTGISRRRSCPGAKPLRMTGASYVRAPAPIQSCL